MVAVVIGVTVAYFPLIRPHLPFSNEPVAVLARLRSDPGYATPTRGQVGR
ncbi:hypothetical protein [Cryptosporangium sp. NPDC048952]